MSLTNYPFVFYDNDEELLRAWGEVLEVCKGKTINKIYSVWDELSNEWFEEAPILVQFSHATLAITVKSERYIALALNKILPNQKPVWFDEEQINEMLEIEWEEELNWREYSELSDSFGKTVKNISLAHDYYNSAQLIGIMIEIYDSENIIICDVGDIIAGFKETD